MDGWQRAKLNVPTAIMTDANGKEVPIPPPRRKRPSHETQSVEKPRSGFKELFGSNNISRRSSCDSAMHAERVAAADKEKFEAQQRRTQSAVNLMPQQTLAKLQIETRQTVAVPQSLVLSSATPSPNHVEHHRLQRKISRVGNKKSDKFFGENLSDCLSDEPISPGSDTMGDEILRQVTSGNVVTVVTTETITPTLAANTKDEIDIFIERNMPHPNVEEIVKISSVESGTISISDEIVISASPITPSADNETLKKETEVGDVAAPKKRDSLDKKAEFLMAMLDDDNLYKDIRDDTSTATDETVVPAPPRRKHSKQHEAEKSKIESNEPTIKAETITSVKAAVDQSVDDVDYYKGRAPVEEPIIVPKRRHYGHICDGDHHLHHHDHTHIPAESRDEVDTKSIVPSVEEITSAPETIKTTTIVSSAPIACPKKPKRDFAIYEKSKQEANSSSSSSPEDPKPAKRTIRKKQRQSQSSENLTKPVDAESSPEKMTQPKKSLERQRTEPNPKAKLDAKLKKCKSSSSFLTQELMSQIVERVYGFQDPYAEDHGYDDYSTKVTPNSKLTTRKISTSKRDGNVPAIKEDTTEDNDQSQIKKISTNENVSAIEIAPVSTNTSASRDVTAKAVEKASQEIVNHNKSKKETVSFIEIEKLHAHPGHNRIVKSDVGSIISQPHIAEDIEKILKSSNPDDEAISHVLDDIYKTNSSILEEFQKYLNDGNSDDQDSDCKPANTNNIDKNCNLKTNENFTDKSLTDKPDIRVEIETITTTNNKNNNPPNEDGVKKLLFVNVNGERRDSIVDVDQWFLRHNEFGDHPRRGSESGITNSYDTKKIFPFGKLGKGTTGATEFFESKQQSKSVENVSNNDNETKEESPIEHSTLLKYLK